MLTRQKTILSLLMQIGRPLSPTVFVKLVFLLRQETDLAGDKTFYDFVPYRFGPFSFTLYWDLGGLRQNGYVTSDEKIALRERTLRLAEKHVQVLSASIRSSVADILKRYGQMNQKDLVREVYSRYPWFALNSELPERNHVSVQRPQEACPAVYTVGYEGRSVDAFFNHLLERGIQVVVDVRANPVSRKYGFSRRRLAELCKRLELEYRHVPALGISSADRAELNDIGSYHRLLRRYEETMLPERLGEVQDLGRLMRRQPSVLLCVEKDVQCCHRSRLANAVARETGLKVVHI